MRKKVEKLFTKVSVKKVRTIFKIYYNSMLNCNFNLSIIYPGEKIILVNLGNIKDVETLRNLCNDVLAECEK